MVGRDAAPVAARASSRWSSEPGDSFAGGARFARRSPATRVYSPAVVAFVPSRVNRLVLAMIGATLVMSSIAAIDARHGGSLYRWLALVPRDVWHGQLWRLVTWVLIERSPLALLFRCGALFYFGDALATRWGTAGLARYVAAIVAIAAVGTSVVALVLPAAWHLPHLGGVALGGALVVAWALAFPDRRIPVYFVVELGGPVLAYGVVALTWMFAMFYGVAWFLPQLFAEGAALLAATGTARRLRRRVRRWRSGLRVVRGGRFDA